MTDAELDVEWQFALNWYRSRWREEKRSWWKEKLYDATVDGFLNARRNFNGRGRFRGFLVVCIGCEWLKVPEYMNRHKRGREPEQLSAVDADACLSLIPSTEAATDARDFYDFCLSKLSPHSREVLAHYLLHSSAETAAHFGVSQSWVRQIVARCSTRLWSLIRNGGDRCAI